MDNNVVKFHFILELKLHTGTNILCHVAQQFFKQNTKQILCNFMQLCTHSEIPVWRSSGAANTIEML